MPPPLSITTGSFFPEPTIRAIERIHRLGFSTLELTIQESDVNFGFSRTHDKEFFQKILQLSRRLNLRVSTVHAPYLSAVQMFSEKVRVKITDIALQGASFLQSELLIIHPYHIFVSYEGAVSFLDGKLAFEESLLPGFKPLLRRAEEEEQVTFAIENIAHWNDSPLLNNPHNMLTLVKALGSERVKVDLDLFHSEMGKCTNLFLRELSRLIVSVHVSDISNHGARTLPGKGKLDWSVVCGRLKALPSLHHVVMEANGRFSEEEVRQSARSLSRLLSPRSLGPSRN